MFMWLLFLQSMVACVTLGGGDRGHVCRARIDVATHRAGGHAGVLAGTLC